MAENEPVTEGPEELMRQVAELRGQVRHLEFERDILGGTVEIQKRPGRRPGKPEQRMKGLRSLKRLLFVNHRGEVIDLS